MSARSILIAIALSAWLLASVVAFFIVAYMSFFGVAFIGLVICYVSAQFELDGDRPVGSPLATSFLGAQQVTEHVVAQPRFALSDDRQKIGIHFEMRGI